MGAFANAASRRSRPKVTKTVRISDEFRHSSQAQWNLHSNESATETSSSRSIVFGCGLCGLCGLRGLCGSSSSSSSWRGRGRIPVEVPRWPASEGVSHCCSLAGFGVSLMNVPEDSTFGTSKVGPESMPRRAWAICGVVLSRASGRIGFATTTFTTTFTTALAIAWRVGLTATTQSSHSPAISTSTTC